MVFRIWNIWNTYVYDVNMEQAIMYGITKLNYE